MLPCNFTMSDASLAVTGPTLEAHALVIPRDATDQQLIAAWLFGLAAETQRAYSRDVAGCLAFVGVPLRQVRLTDLQAWAASLGGAPSSRARAIAAVKSLLSFAHSDAGYLPFNVGKRLKIPPLKDTLAERILS